MEFSSQLLNWRKFFCSGECFRFTGRDSCFKATATQWHIIKFMLYGFIEREASYLLYPVLYITVISIGINQNTSIVFNAVLSSF